LNCEHYIDVTDKSNAVEVGEKYALHWHREFFDKNDKLICAFLRTSHPERLNKEDFVQNVLDFLKETENK
jgi:intein-encoded DNA endonuclease-like protein